MSARLHPSSLRLRRALALGVLLLAWLAQQLMPAAHSRLMAGGLAGAFCGGVSSASVGLFAARAPRELLALVERRGREDHTDTRCQACGCMHLPQLALPGALPVLAAWQRGFSVVVMAAASAPWRHAVVTRARGPPRQG